MNSPSPALRAEAERLVAQGILPGGVILRARQGEPELLWAFGDAVVEPRRIPATPDTVYDLASLTKPLVTTALVLQLVQSGDLDLDATLADFNPRCPLEKSGISIRQLLSHASGIRDWYPLYSGAQEIAGYRDIILTLPLSAAPGTQVIYSCPNLILLADLIEKIAGQPFRRAAETMLFRPLGLTEAWLGAPTLPRERIAATERDQLSERNMAAAMGISFPFRDGVIWGETHDGNSHHAGGSAGNAGLFATARGALTLLNEYSERAQLLRPGIRAMALRNLTPFGPQHRGLGWQLATSPECSAGDSLSAASFGHTGFTGTSIWHDPNRDMTLLVFTNRVHPVAREMNMNEIRRRLHRLMMDL